MRDSSRNFNRVYRFSFYPTFRAIHRGRVKREKDADKGNEVFRTVHSWPRKGKKEGRKEGRFDKSNLWDNRIPFLIVSLSIALSSSWG